MDGAPDSSTSSSESPNTGDAVCASRDHSWLECRRRAAWPSAVVASAAGGVATTRVLAACPLSFFDLRLGIATAVLRHAVPAKPNRRTEEE